MDLMNDKTLLRQIIMDHYQYPRNHELAQDENYHQIHMASDSCIDDITVQACFDQDTLKDVRFDGTACTIATSSTSIMTELLKGKSVEEAKAIIGQYMNMIDEKDYDPEVLEEAIAFQNVSRQANRINCATIGWRAITSLIKEHEDDHE